VSLSSAFARLFENRLALRLHLLLLELLQFVSTEDLVLV